MIVTLCVRRVNRLKGEEEVEEVVVSEEGGAGLDLMVEVMEAITGIMGEKEEEEEERNLP